MQPEFAKRRSPLSGHVKTGVALATALVFYFGSEKVGEAFLTAGWRGLAAMSAAYFASVIVCAIAWRRLIVAPLPNATLVCYWAR